MNINDCLENSSMANTIPSVPIQRWGDQRQPIKIKLLPKWLTQYAALVYFFALAIVSLMYSNYTLPWYYMLSGTLAVLLFFLYAGTLIEQTALVNMRKERRFERRIVISAFILRLIWMFFSYVLFMQNYGDPFGFENSDALFYDDLGQSFAKAIQDGTFKETWDGNRAVLDISDLGYALYLGFIYWITGNNIIVVRFLNCIWSAWTVLLIYRLAKRNFNPQVARITAIFCALWPNFWYYCGTNLKETEMVFLSVLFVEQADQMLRSRQFTAWKVIPVLLIGAALFTLRTPLALVAFLALIFSVVMTSSRVVSWGKRIIVGILAILLIGVVAGNRLQEESRSLLEQVQSGQQQHNMEWRTKRDNGNVFAKYAGKSVFAPLIFTIPFPSFVRPFDGQDVQQLLNGGNFVKNIISFFTIFAMFLLLVTGEWREHLLPLSFMLGYLVVLTLSTFAQAERFHQPAMPFEMMFAAFGMSIAISRKKYKRWFTYWCVLIFVACIAWNWFKMEGRGLS